MSIDIDSIFTDLSIDLGEYESVVKFIGAVTCYLIFILLYFTASSLDKDSWIDRYVTRWSQTKSKVTLYWFLAVIFSLVAAALVDMESVDRVISGEVGADVGTFTCMCVCMLSL